jgi:NAD(P)-dependent dehydrogenase (short-subunit alcohol dehydrogenase family)
MRQVAVITGGTRGIGAATARMLARQGHHLCLTYAGNDAAAARIVRELEAQGGQATAIRADSADPAGVAEVFRVADELGPLRVLVNCAGVAGRICRVEDLQLDVLRRTLDVNVVGTVLCCQQAVRRMSTRHGGSGGVIVNLSSMAAVTGSPGELVHYAAAKGAVESFTLGLGREVATEGIRVNAVSPGLIDTDIHAEAGDASRVERYATRMPMARVGQPEEVAAAIAWLASDQASYVTAVVLPVAGGR